MASKPVLTEDGSVTRFHPEYEEHYHSMCGAHKEALKRFVEPCRLIEVALQKGAIRFLDVGFGLGVNLGIALHELQSRAPKVSIEVVSLEKELLSLSDLRPHIASLPGKETSTFLEQLVVEGEVSNTGLKMELIQGDALEQVPLLPGEFDAIFLDPFSPKKNPEPWQAHFLGALWEVSSKGGILSTYSAAASVRMSLMRAGWEIGLGPRVGRKSSGTLASKGSVDPPLPALDPKQRRSLEKRLTE